MEMEKFLRMMADMNSLAPGKDKLSSLIADTLAEADSDDELGMDELDMVLAARKDESFRRGPNGR